MFCCYTLASPSTMTNQTQLTLSFESTQPFTNSSIEGDTTITNKLPTSSPTSLPNTDQLKKVGSSPTCFLYKEDQNTIWYSWWRKTHWYLKNEAKAKHAQKKILWGLVKRADIWARFRECAACTTGEPRVICQICDSTLHHPSGGAGKTNAGNTGLVAHLRSTQCQKSAKAKGVSGIITTPWRESVCLTITLTITLFLMLCRLEQTEHEFYNHPIVRNCR